MTVLDEIRSRVDFAPNVGVVLGSGLSALAERVDVAMRLPYADIPGFPRSTVEGHRGEFVFGTLGDVPVVLMNGRVHLYEGYSVAEVVTPARCMAALGVDTVILTNASGGLNESFRPGDLMCITDHIASFVPSPLIGPNDDAVGPRFPDMSEVYDAELRALLHDVAKEHGIELRDGVYIQTTGPCFETPAETHMYKLLGADAVGMSTAVEANVLHHMGVRLLGISCVTNVATDSADCKTDHEEVQKTADAATEKLSVLVEGVIRRSHP